MSNPRTILVTGAQGQLGFELQRSLAALGHVVALARAECDLSNVQALRETIRQLRPALIVNAAAYTAVDKAEAEPELAQRINAEALAVMGEEAKALSAGVIHYSTDYVFDGSKQGAYLESDVTGPLGVYGASKLAGEQALAASGADYWIFRTCWVYGLHGQNFMKTMLRLGKSRDSLSVVADQFGVPTSAAFIADITAQVVAAIGRGQPIAQGIYHLSASGRTSWHGYACHLLARAKLRGLSLAVNVDDIRAIPASDYPTPARRPANSQLDCSKLEVALGIRMPLWTVAIDQTIDLLMENAGI